MTYDSLIECWTVYNVNGAMLDNKNRHRDIPSHMRPFLQKGGNYNLVERPSEAELQQSRLEMALEGQVQCIYDLHIDTTQPINAKTKEPLQRPETDMHKLAKEVRGCHS
jgi:predicted deacylase